MLQKRNNYLESLNIAGLSSRSCAGVRRGRDGPPNRVLDRPRICKRMLLILSNYIEATRPREASRRRGAGHFRSRPSGLPCLFGGHAHGYNPVPQTRSSRCAAAGGTWPDGARFPVDRIAAGPSACALHQLILMAKVLIAGWNAHPLSVVNRLQLIEALARHS